MLIECFFGAFQVSDEMRATTQSGPDIQRHHGLPRGPPSDSLHGSVRGRLPQSQGPPGCIPSPISEVGSGAQSCISARFEDGTTKISSIVLGFKRSLHVVISAEIIVYFILQTLSVYSR